MTWRILPRSRSVSYTHLDVYKRQRFEMKTKDLFRYSFFMANKHLLTTILCTALLVGAFALCLLVNLLFAFVVVSVYIYISVALLERVFKNYMPSEDDALEEEEIEGFNLDAERQAIIDQYLGKGKFNPDIDGSEEEYRIVKVNEDGQEEVEEDEYKVCLLYTSTSSQCSGVGCPAPGCHWIMRSSGISKSASRWGRALTPSR